MPLISMFYGIIIRMYFAPGEHSPPHFHAYYGEYRASFSLETFDIIKGDFPRKQTRLVQAWAELHTEELKADWELAMNGETPLELHHWHKDIYMYPAVISVKALDDYKLLLKFDNDEDRIFDVKPVLDFGSFGELKDESMFKSVHIVCDTIEWGNGLDLDPEYLYEKSVLVDSDEKIVR